MTVAEAINPKSSLTNDDEVTLEKPLVFDRRTNQTLPADVSMVQKQLNEINEHAIVNEIKVNKKKTKIMLFNNAKNNDFTPVMKLDNDLLEVSEEMKLLGVKITTDL